MIGWSNFMPRKITISKEQISSFGIYCSIACCFHELTPSTPMSVQDRISPYNINTV